MSDVPTPEKTTKEKPQDSPLPAGRKPRLVFDGVLLPQRKRKETASSSSYAEAEAYAPSRYGEMGEYMRRKRLKLTVQNEEITSQSRDKPQIFKNLRIYINGWTDPPLQDLRRMITEHGGVFVAYLDRKGLVTHILSMELTPAKVKEFAHLKVARPEWIVQSVEQQTLLRWQDFILRPGDSKRTEGQIGSSPQKSLIASIGRPIRRDNSLDIDNLPHDEVVPSSSTEMSPASKSYTDTVPIPTTPVPSKPPKPSYALHDSNIHAQRLMGTSDEWRVNHTSAAGDKFVENYYQKSRLHHLSTWKAELKELVAQARQGQSTKTDIEPPEAHEKGGASMRGSKLGESTMLPTRSGGASKGKGKQKDDRVIMHCDFDSFFLSASLVDRPHLKGKPVVVCHGREGAGIGSTSEIASASYEARAKGIRNGMSLGQGRQLCPDVETVPYEFERYKRISIQFYTILMAAADDIQVVSVDEALLDVTRRVATMRNEASIVQIDTNVDFAKVVAERIRDDIRKTIGCEASIGISHNILLARLATRIAKPAKSHHIFPHDISEHLSNIDIRDLPGIGRSMQDKVDAKFGVTTCGKLLECSNRAGLIEALGPATGDKLWNYLHGIDETPLAGDEKRKSVSADINYGIRFKSLQEAETFMQSLSKEVSSRLAAVRMRGKSLTLKVLTRRADAPQEAAKFLGHGMCDSWTKTTSITGPRGSATLDVSIIYTEAWKLLQSFGFDVQELRGIGIQIQKLEDETQEAQNSVLPFFKPVSPKGLQSDVDPKPGPRTPTKGHKRVDLMSILPTASQVDPDVLAALPSDIRAELEAEIRKVNEGKSTTAPVHPEAGPSTKLSRGRGTAEAPIDLDGETQAFLDTLTPELRNVVEEDVRGIPKRQAITPSKELPKPKSTSVTPTKRAEKHNVKHITKQLATKRRIPVSPAKARFFDMFAAKAAKDVTEEELVALDIDPIVFAQLPPDLQKEQLSEQRYLKRNSTKLRPPDFQSTRTSRASSRHRSISIEPGVQSSPVARFTRPAALRKKTTIEDIQNLVRGWVDAGSETGPEAGEVEKFTTYVLECLEGELGFAPAGLQRVVDLMRWWKHLCRNHWPDTEISLSEGKLRDHKDMQWEERRIGDRWWLAFAEVQEKIDALVRKRFGGRLRL